MQYDFDRIINRRDTASLKWNVGEEELPMWVADMDFAVAPEIQKALEKRVAHGIFGYAEIEEDWYHSYQDWWQKRHDFTIEKDWLIFCTGVIPALSSMVRKLTTPAEKIVIQTPVYNIFYNSILNNGRQVLESPLLYEDGRYGMDFEDLEKKLSDPQTTMMILCNPQNPAGKIWEKETLERVGALCAKHHVIVISDEIHCDLTAPGRAYTPFASVSDTCRDNSITCMAPTKTFNIAGLQTAAVMVPNPVLRHKVWRGLNTDEVAEPNVFAAVAAVAAFTKGGEWLDALRTYIQQNKDYVTAYLEKNVPGVKAVYSDATYLMWLDVREFLTDSRGNNADSVALADCMVYADSAALADYIRKKTGLYLSAGNQYGGSGKYFLRLNVACPLATVKEGMERLREALSHL